MDIINGCLIRALSFLGGVILLLAVTILAFQCFLYLLPWLAVVVPCVVIVIGVCRVIGNWFSP